MIKFEKCVYSQNGEDGIIEHIFNIIGTTNKIAVEIGVSVPNGGKQNNTRLLSENGWTTYWFDCLDVSNLPSNCVFTKKKLTADNIVDTFSELNIPKNIDLLSIDIDSNDYHLRKALSEYKPKVCIMEYNGVLDGSTEYIMPRNDNYCWQGQRNYGASLKSYTKQANEFGYDLVYCESKGVNAFFVRKDVNLFPVKTSEEAWVILTSDWIKHEEILRRQSICTLYESELGRSADEESLSHYTNSNYSIEEIKNILFNSTEGKRYLVNSAKTKNLLFTPTIINLFSNNMTRVDYFKHKNKSNKIVLSFRGYTPENNLSEFGFWGKRLFNEGYDIICFKSSNCEFYTEIPKEFYFSISEILKFYELKYGVGISMGTYPLVKYSGILNLHKIFCLSARLSPLFLEGNFKTRYEFSKNEVDNNCQFFLFNNPSNIEDTKEAYYYLDRLPEDKTKLYDVDDSPERHAIIETLYDKQIYNDFINSIFIDHKVLDSQFIVENLQYKMRI